MPNDIKRHRETDRHTETEIRRKKNRKIEKFTHRRREKKVYELTDTFIHIANLTGNYRETE